MHGPSREFPQRPSIDAIASDPYLGALIRKLAREFNPRRPPHIDRGDVEAELWLKALSHIDEYDEAKSYWSCFIRTLLLRHLKNMLRDHCATKRDHRRTTSLDAVAELQEPHAEESKDLKVDLGELFPTLSSQEREMCLRLMSDSMSQVARELGVPRTTLQSRIKKLRIRFEDAGLRIYL